MLKYRNAAHYLVGILSALAVIVHPILTAGGLVLFLVYEVNEDWHIKDQAFRDILECAVGYFLATGGLVVHFLAFGGIHAAGG